METEGKYLTEIQKKQEKIITFYGVHKQLSQLVEECAELIVAIQKQQRYDFSTVSDTIFDGVIEEMADVKNLIEQLELYRHYVARGVKITIENKTDRELERIKADRKKWIRGV